MKKIYISLFLLQLLSFASCEDYLSEKPDNRTEINSPEKITELLVSAYPSTVYFEFAETMSDNVFETRSGTLTQNNTANYFWKVEANSRSNDSQANYWNSCYEAIAHANKALEAIENLGSPKYLNPQKGEALMARAYAHFMLVSFWSQRYDPATAATALGIPYITKPENILLAKYKRNSVAEVFDFIQKDIEEGLTLVTDDYAQPKFHFTVDAAKAFASRFYLIKGNWDKVLELSKEFDSKPIGKLRNYNLYKTLDVLTAMKQYSSSDEATNLLIAFPSSNWYFTIRNIKYSFGAPGYQTIIDKSTNIFKKDWLYTPLSVNNFINALLPKFPDYFKVTNATAGIGIAFMGAVLLSNDELYLNRIEALVMKGQISKANDDLEYFLSTRTQGYDPRTDKLTEKLVRDKFPAIKDEYTPFYKITDLQTSYIKAIADTKRRDFIQEGLRWFDIKRFEIVIKRQDQNNPQATLTKKDIRRALQIPEVAIARGIEKNPR